MRLALLGPAKGDVAALVRATVLALDDLRADRVVYLGVDGAMDAVVRGWAALLGVEAPLAERVDPRMVESASAPALAAEVAREQASRRLKRIQSLAGPGVRSLEMLHDRLVLLIDDRSSLDEDDLLPVTVIACGEPVAMFRRVGSRVFIAPGSPSRPGEGVVVFEEELEARTIGVGAGGTEGAGSLGAAVITVRFVDTAGELVRRESLQLNRPMKLRVHGAT